MCIRDRGNGIVGSLKEKQAVRRRTARDRRGGLSNVGIVCCPPSVRCVSRNVIRVADDCRGIGELHEIGGVGCPTADDAIDTRVDLITGGGAVGFTEEDLSLIHISCSQRLR